MSEVKEVGRFLWNSPETANREFRGSNFLTQKYKDNGFQVFRGVAGFPTSFIAKFSSGNSDVKIGIFSDFDALPGLSLANDTDPGHGCSHNLYAASAFGTAMVLKKAIMDGIIDGEIAVIGAPAEESGGSKQYFVSQGILDEFDVFVGMHPVGSVNGVMFKRHIASIEKSYKFKGLQSHAALYPEKGRNALSAMEYMNIGVNYLRGQVTNDVRINYYVKHGGVASNIITDNAEVIYSIRAENLKTADNTAELIDNIALCAASAMRCSLEKTELTRLPNSIPNKIISKLVQDNAKIIGPPKYTEDMQKYVMELGSSKGYLNEIVEMSEEADIIYGSTDEACASWIAPWVRIAFASVPQGVTAHTKNLCKMNNLDWSYIGIEKTIVLSSKTIVDLFKDKSIIQRAKDELKNTEQREGNNVVNVKLTDKLFPRLNGLTLTGNNLIIDLDKFEIFSELCNSNILVFSNDELVGEYPLKDERQFLIYLNKEKIKDSLVVKFNDSGYWCTIAYLSIE